MNSLPDIKIYRGIKNPIFNYIQNKKEYCKNVNKLNKKKLTQNNQNSLKTISFSFIKLR
jgi:hypothetical protein